MPQRPAAHRAPRAPRRAQAGLTLVEAATTVAVAVLLLGSGLPSLQQMITGQQLKAAEARLRTDLQMARGAAVASGRSVRLQTHSGDAGSCYVIHTGAAADCRCDTASASCTGNARLIAAGSFGREHSVALASSARQLVFDGTLGTVTPTSTFTLQSRGGDELRVVVNLMGRSRSCRATGTLQGYVPC